MCIKRSTDLLQSVLSRFPSGYSLAFAYGSGVFKRLSHESVKRNMIDFILVVRDPHKWHSANLKMNPRDYSWLRMFGSKTIAAVQKRGVAGVYFNTMVDHKNLLLKYGVISHTAAMQDLLDWDSLYIAGRLHKPVQILGSRESS